MNINMSMYDFVKYHRDRNDVPAIIYYGSHIDTDEFYEDIHSLACYLNSIGVKRGDSVAICLPNFPQALIAFYATNYLGAVANVIHPLVPPLGLKSILEEIPSKALLIYDVFYNKYRNVLNGLDVKVILCSAGEYMPRFLSTAMSIYSKTLGIKCGGNVINYHNILRGQYPEVNSVADNGESDACYLHSGGTTGQPKTVVMSNRAMNACGRNINDLIGTELIAGDRMLMVLPLFHVFGLGVCMHSTLCSNATAILIPQFNAKKVCKIVAKHNATFLCGVPSMYTKMMACKEFRGAHLKKMKYCYCGGDKLKANVIEEFDRIMAKYGSNCHLCEGYGLTEATICTVNATKNSELGSVGFGIGDCRIMVVDDSNIEVPYGESGEIAVGGSAVMSRYYNDDITTGKVIFTDDKGIRYIRTGDIGRMSQGGHLYFIDRRKRMLKISGINVFPSEVESVIYESVPEVKYCVALETKIDNKSSVKLYVVLNDKLTLDKALEDKIKSAVAVRLMKYSIPKVIMQKESLPLTHIGKVDYKLILDSESVIANKE